MVAVVTGECNIQTVDTVREVVKFVEQWQHKCL